MSQILLIAVLLLTFFAVSTVLGVFGKGGGDFYVPLLITAGVSFHEASTTSLFILILAGLSMAHVFHRERMVDWALALVVFSVTGIFSFLGGYVSVSIPPAYLKATFAAMLLVSAYFIRVKKDVLAHRNENRKSKNESGRGEKENIGRVWHRPYGGGYNIAKKDMVVMLFLFSVVGFVAGMVGISGGGVIVPVMILVGGVPIRVAFGTNAALVFMTSTFGFLGHAAAGGVNWHLTLPLAVVAIVGSQIGSRISHRIETPRLSSYFVWVLVGAAVWMLVKIYI